MGNNTTTHHDAAQAAQILAGLAKGNTINPMQALRMFGCFRLGARIWELRQMGVNIASKMVPFVSETTGKKGRHSVYWLEGAADELPEAAKQMLNLKTAKQ